MCTRRCFFNASADRNVFGHKSHCTGRSPVCMRSCISNCWLVKNSLGQYLHGFFCRCGVPAWVRRCSRKLSLRVKTFLQTCKNISSFVSFFETSSIFERPINKHWTHLTTKRIKYIAVTTRLHYVSIQMVASWEVSVTRLTSEKLCNDMKINKP